MTPHSSVEISGLGDARNRATGYDGRSPGAAVRPVGFNKVFPKTQTPDPAAGGAVQRPVDSGHAALCGGKGLQ